MAAGHQPRTSGLGPSPSRHPVTPPPLAHHRTLNVLHVRGTPTKGRVRPPQQQRKGSFAENEITQRQPIHPFLKTKSTSRHLISSHLNRRKSTIQLHLDTPCSPSILNPTTRGGQLARNVGSTTGKPAAQIAAARLGWVSPGTRMWVLADALFCTRRPDPRRWVPRAGRRQQEDAHGDHGWAANTPHPLSIWA